MNLCPTAQELEQWLDEDRSDAQQGELASHISGCVQCQAALERLTEQSWPSSTRLPAAESAVAEAAAPAEFLARLKQSPRSVDTAPTVPTARLYAVAERPTVAGYEILEELGRGGMGVVYKARHRALDRLVALKMILSGSHAGRKDLDRFRLEAESVARLHHPNIVQIFDIGESSGRPYFALEYVEQGSLAQRLLGDPQPVEPTVRLIETLARAIHFAHERGIIHRDLKPANILLQKRETTNHTNKKSEEDEGQTKGQKENEKHEALSDSDSCDSCDSWFDYIPKITDFGLAKRLDGAGPRSHTGEVLGTPSYMAPEQAGARIREIGPATDVYALGTILYDMLSGRPPFEGAYTLDTVLQVLYDEPSRPSHWRQKVPRDLETICLKCLQKEPARRYASAAALADDLRRFRRGDPIAARPIGLFERGWKWAKRRPLIASLLAVIALVTLIGFAGITWQWQVAVAERNEKEEQRQQARTALYYSRIAQSRLRWRVNELPAALRSLEECLPTEGQLDRRGWEWYHLYAFYQPELFTFHHPRPGSEGAVAFRPDGRAVASLVRSATDGEGEGSHFCLRDTKSGQLIQEKSPDGPFHRLVFRPDGRRLLLGGADGTIRVWDALTYEEIARYTIHNTRISDLAFRSDGKIAASAAVALSDGDSPRGGEVRIWNAENGQIIHTLRAEGGLGFHGVAFHPTRPLLATAGEDKTVRLWNTANGQEMCALEGHKSAVHDIAFSPDGKLLVSAGSNGTIKIWDLHIQKETDPPIPKVVQSLTGRTGAVLSLEFSPDGRYFAYAGTDQTVRVWDVEEGTGHITFRGHTAVVECTRFSPDGRQLISCAPARGEVKVWDLTKHPEFATLAHTDTDVESIAFRDDGRSLVSLTKSGRLQTWDAASGMPRGEHALNISAETIKPTAVLAAFAPGGRRVAARCRREYARVRIWDVDSGKPVVDCNGHELPVHCLCFSGDGRYLASGACEINSSDGAHEIKIWDTTDGRVQKTFSGRGRLFTACFSPDGRRLAVGGAMGVQMYEWSTDSLLMEIPARASAVTALAFSADGRRLAAAGVEDSRIHLWSFDPRRASVEQKEPLLSLAAPRLLCDLAFSPDGKRLAGASRDAIKMWDAETGVEVLTLRGAPQRYRDPPFNARVIFDADGTHLAATNWNESISVWDAPLRTDEEKQLQEQEARRQAAEERAPFWHLQEAEHCLRHKNSAAAQFHLQCLKDAALPPLLQARKARLLDQSK